MRNLKAVACAAALALAIAGCGGDDESDDATQAVTTPEAAPPATQPEEAEESERPNNDPVVEEDAGTKSIGKLVVTENEFTIERSEQALLTEGVWTIKVVNRGKQTHALDVEGPNGETEIGEVEPGETRVTRAYLVSGEYELYCPIGDHAERGMRSKLPVGADKNPE
jgi:uncharacterized cupredoxin-like copper-binding protein